MKNQQHVSELGFADIHQGDVFELDHAFTQEDVDRITSAAREARADAIVTTEKDAVRLEGLAHGDVPIYAAQLEIESDDEVRLKSLLLRTVNIRKR